MRPADTKAVERALGRMKSAHRTVLLFSPAIDFVGNGALETAALGAVWPDAEVLTSDRDVWNLDKPKPNGVRHADVGLICNTFMCSRDPALWLRHLSEAVDVLVIQDMAVCMRVVGRHCAVEAGDVARYSVSSHGIIGQTDPDLEVFDLSACGYEVLDAEGYDDGGLKFVVVLRLR